MSGSKEAENKKVELINQAISKLDTSSFVFHKKSVDDTLKELKSTYKGIGKNEARTRYEKYGPNALDQEPEESLLKKILEQFEDLLVQILLGAAIISFVFACLDDGDAGFAAFVEPFVIMCILVINAAVAVWQDSNADNALEALKKMQAQTC